MAGLLASQCLKDLRKMFVTLPKNSNGRLERRSLRLEDQFVKEQCCSHCSPNGSRQCLLVTAVVLSLTPSESEVSCVTHSDRR